MMTSVVLLFHQLLDRTTGVIGGDALEGRLKVEGDVHLGVKIGLKGGCPVAVLAQVFVVVLEEILLALGEILADGPSVTN